MSRLDRVATVLFVTWCIIAVFGLIMSIVSAVHQNQ